MRVRELVVSYRVRSDCELVDCRVLDAPRDAATMFAAILGHEAVEVFGVLCVTTKRRFIAYHEVGRGSIDSVVVSPREVFQAALLAHASAVVVGHNHPSGDPTPSPDDRELTRRLTAGGSLIGVSVLDHIVVGHDGRYFSFKETGGL